MAHDTAAKLDKLVTPKRTAIGSVDGRLVAISIARTPRISVIHHLTKRSVSCQFDERGLESVKSLLGKRVIIHGRLHKNQSGDTIKIDPSELMEFTASAWRSLLVESSTGVIPDFADTTDTEEYLRNTRG